jgi:hypothetical protein
LIIGLESVLNTLRFIDEIQQEGVSLAEVGAVEALGFGPPERHPVFSPRTWREHGFAELITQGKDAVNKPYKLTTTSHPPNADFSKFRVYLPHFKAGTSHSNGKQSMRRNTTVHARIVVIRMHAGLSVGQDSSVNGQITRQQNYNG